MRPNQLLEAARNGRKDEMIELIEEGAAIDARDEVRAVRP
jgi:hypothetical protein